MDHSCCLYDRRDRPQQISATFHATWLFLGDGIRFPASYEADHSLPYGYPVSLGTSLLAIPPYPSISSPLRSLLLQLPDQGVVTKFHALRPPSIGVKDYLER